MTKIRAQYLRNRSRARFAQLTCWIKFMWHKGITAHHLLPCLASINVSAQPILPHNVMLGHRNNFTFKSSSHKAQEAVSGLLLVTTRVANRFSE
jgi:hypothetical protein